MNDSSLKLHISTALKPQSWKMP